MFSICKHSNIKLIYTIHKQSKVLLGFNYSLLVIIIADLLTDAKHPDYSTSHNRSKNNYNQEEDKDPKQQYKENYY